MSSFSGCVRLKRYLYLLAAECKRNVKTLSAVGICREKRQLRQGEISAGAVGKRQWLLCRNPKCTAPAWYENYPARSRRCPSTDRALLTRVPGGSAFGINADIPINLACCSTSLSPIPLYI